MSDTGAIYIGGLSYSGKTQMRLLLMEQPGILITRRTYMWPRFYGRFGDLSRDDNLARCLDAMLAAPGIRALEPDRARIRREFRAGSPTYPRLFALFHADHARRRGARRWGDQLGGIEQYAALILTNDPDARIIHMVRDPRARLAELLGAGRRPGIAGWETQQWRRSAGLALGHRAQYPDRYRVVRYEDLREDAEQIRHEVLAFLGEKEASLARPDPALWNGEARRVPGVRLVAYVERQAAGEMTRLGYTPARPTLGPRQWMLLNFVDAPLNRVGIVMRRLRQKDSRAVLGWTARSRGVAVHG